jgi:hypothetical protein
MDLLAKNLYYLANLPAGTGGIVDYLTIQGGL